MHSGDTRSYGERRRLTRWGGLVLVAALFVAACGDDDSEPDDGQSGSSPQSSAADGTSVVPVESPLDSTATSLSAPGTDPEQSGQDSFQEIDTSAHLTTTYTSEPTTLDPHQQPASSGRAYWMYAYDRLFDIASGQPEPELVTSYEVSDDGLRWTLDIRTDVTFADGSPLNADAVKASLEAAKTRGIAGVSSALATVESVDATGPATVVLTLSEPTPELAAHLGDAPGAIINPRALADPEQLATQTAGSGPYQSVEFVPESRVVLERTDQPYWNPEGGRLGGITVEFVPEAQAALNGLQSGDYDIAWILASLSQSQIGSVAEAGGFEIHDQPAIGPQSLFLRNTRGALSDKRVRQAISYAIDRESIAAGLFEGGCTATTQYFQPGTPSYLDQEPYKFDAERAQALLEEAGATGAQLELMDGGDQAAHVVAQALQEQLNAVGFEASVRTLPTGSPAEFAAGQRDTWSIQIPWLPHPLLSTVRYFLEGGFLELAKTEDETLQSIVTRIKDPASTEAELDEAYQELGQEVADLSLIVPICTPVTKILAHPSIIGLDRSMAGTPDLRFAAVLAGS